MKKLIIGLVLILSALIGLSQVTDVGELRIADAVTALGRNLPVGTKVYNIATGEYWVTTAGVVSTETLTTGSASFTLLNDAGTDDQTASEVSIADAGEIITATDVEGALQENRTAIDLNSAKVTNVSTNLSLGTVTSTTMDVNSSDGTNATLTAATNTAAGVATAAQITKLEGVATGAEVNLTSITEAFEEASGTPTEHSLSQNAVTAQNCRVSLNGATLNPADYTLTTSTITIGIPVLQFDKVVITYSY